jgi:hypothetical protein
MTCHIQLRKKGKESNENTNKKENTCFFFSINKIYFFFQLWFLLKLMRIQLV